MARVALQNYGLVRIGRIELSDDLNFSIIFELDEAKAWKKSIYAFVVGGEIKRIASSNYYLSDRFRKWNHDVTNEIQRAAYPFWTHRIVSKQGIGRRNRAARSRIVAYHPERFVRFQRVVSTFPAQAKLPE